MIVVMVRVDWGRETIAEILPELRKHVDVTLEEPGCDEYTFGIYVNNPDIVVASEVYRDYQAHLDHFTTAQWYTSAPSWRRIRRGIDAKTYEAAETKHALDSDQQAIPT